MNPVGGSFASSSLGVIILAAGEGTRMKSRVPKVLQPLMGKPMLLRLLPTVLSLDPAQVVIVIGHGADAVKDAVLDGGVNGRVIFVTQEVLRGTAFAVQVADEALRGPIERGDISHLLVVYGDNPLSRAETLTALIDGCRGGAEGEAPAGATATGAAGEAASVLTVVPRNRKGYGRIVRNADGSIKKVVEEKDATPEEKEIREVNAGAYCFQAAKLFAALEKIEPSPASGEYYLTDVIEVFVTSGERVVPVQAENEWETMGLDSRDKLAGAHAGMRDRINARWMAEGVFIMDPSTTWIEPEVELSRDVTILPGTWLKGRTTVGEGTTVGPYSVITDTTIGKRATVQFAVVDDSVVGDGADLGPYCRLRGGSVIEEGAKVGTFVETKKTHLGAGSKIPHLSYFGDAEVGENVNVGAGSITCNYDGKRKHKTIIDDDVFVGSDTMLVAPVHLGKGSGTGAGAVVTKDVPPGDLVVGAPAKKLRRRDKDAPGEGEGATH